MAALIVFLSGLAYVALLWAAVRCLCWLFRPMGDK